jgi:hypothetical protein
MKAVLHSDSCGCRLIATPGLLMCRWLDGVRFGSFSTELGCPRHVRFPPDRDRGADIPVRQLRANSRHSAGLAIRSKVFVNRHLRAAAATVY